MKLLAFAATAALVLTPSTSAQAQSLSEASIQAFLNETTRLTHLDNGMNDEQITAYLEAHIGSKGKFESKIMYDIPSYPPQMRQISLNKKDFIKNVIEGRKTMQNYTSSVTLKTATINGNAATIQTTTRESGIAPVEGQGTAPFEGISNCNQTLIQDGGNIILTSASCETIITFKE